MFSRRLALAGNQNKLMWALIAVVVVVAGFFTFNTQIGYVVARVNPRAGEWFHSRTREIRIYEGLDIRGGVRVVLQAQTQQYKGKWTDEKLQLVRNIIEKRVNSQGVSEPSIVTKYPDQIIIELPGLKNVEEALQQIQTTASLQFYLLPELGNEINQRTGPWEMREPNESDPNASPTIYDRANGQPLTQDQLNAAIFDNTGRQPVIEGAELEPDCKAAIQGPANQTVIEFTLNSKGAQSFEDVTRANQGEHLAIFLDRKLLSAPYIKGPIGGGKGVIEGSFSLESAKKLADTLNAGALPVPLKAIETRKLEATLGAEAVRQTTMAGLIGLSLVLIFMLLYYRLPGLLADLALILYTIFTFAIFKGMLKFLNIGPITLTLPGIAGFILSIGMAVDANILIFERMKEELRSGKSLRNSIDAGFKRAFTAIRDSNVCTIITCAILYSFGTGAIRGFALTLGIGVLLSMFTAITVSRTFLFTLVSQPWAQKPDLYGLKVQWHPKLRVMSRKWLWLGLSGAVIVPGLIAVAMGGIKLSIDFTGGTELQMAFQQRHSVGEIENALVAFSPSLRDSRVVLSEDPTRAYPHQALITVKLDADPKKAADQRTGLVNSLTQKWSGQAVQYSYVSGTISDELLYNAFLAVIYASALIIIYLAWQFAIGGFKEGLKYGTCAVIALFHDVFVVGGVFAILGKAAGWQVDSLFVTAMLTVIGFSVHDTIIVFDRMRENLGHRAKGETFSEVADRSIDQTIARSINTSFTVILTLLALFFLGGDIIHHFVTALLVGIISGTYSSIFNASVLLVMWKQKDASFALPGGGVIRTGSAPLRPAPGNAPGDRPLVAPGDRPLVAPQTPSAPAASVSEEAEAAAPETDRAPRAPRTGAPRRQAQRRRRM
jgi:SecD/SecF fusion protein